MNLLFYNLFVWLYSFTAIIISPFNEKAKLWIKGRKNIFENLQAAFINNNAPVIWIHCASLGEFEQGRPVIEKLKELYPDYKILLTFFSPSGYEVQKNYAQADYIFYLPIDKQSNAKKFLAITNPALIIFIKYEFWFYYLQEAKRRSIPLLLVSGIFRKQQPFFKWYGDVYRKMLQCFTHLFVQGETALSLLHSININNASVSGDTRFDRVISIANKFEEIDIIEQFCFGRQVIVAGSTWSEDDEELDHFANTNTEKRFIIAPHTIDKERLQECRRLYKNSALFSIYKTDPAAHNINTLVIDNIGMLNRLYKYADVCYVGGAFGDDGVHNVLEAAVYYKPVIFGPVFDKYIEAVELIDTGGAFTINSALQLEDTLNTLFNEDEKYQAASSAAGEYVSSKTGATEKLMQYIQEKRLLTN